MAERGTDWLIAELEAMEAEPDDGQPINIETPEGFAGGLVGAVPRVMPTITDEDREKSDDDAS